MIYFNYRKPANLTTQNVNNIDTICIHHTGGYNTIEQDTDYHIDNNKWSWLGYGFYIDDYEIYWVRGYENINAAVKDHNNHTVNIALKGNFDKYKPSDKQYILLQQLVDRITKDVPTIKYLKAHRDFNNTTCPGAYFDFSKIKITTKATQEYIKNVDILVKELGLNSPSYWYNHQDNNVRLLIEKMVKRLKG